MAENSKIEWTDHTFNPWTGCTRVSPGCQHCYAESWANRSGLVEWGPKAPRRRTSAANWAKPRKWNAEALRTGVGVRPKVFAASLADIFDDHASIDPQWRVDFWRLVYETPALDWLLLTKRPEAWPAYLPVTEPHGAFDHVRLGVTIEDQERFNERGPILQMIADSGWNTFVSYEPALGPVDWSPALKPHAPAIGWMIAGCESGPRARPGHPDWIRSTRDQMAAAGVPFFFKQWGAWVPGENVTRTKGTVETAFWFGDRWSFDRENLASEGGHRDDEPDLYRLGKARAGRLLDGVQHDGMPGHG